MVRATQEGLNEAPETNLARRILARFGLTLPVDVIALARTYAEVFIEFIPLDVDGVCYDLKRPGIRPKIVLNKLRPPTRLRFTAAHELGHVLIPWHTGIMVDDTSSYNPGVVDHYKMEEEANRFASELLLPTDRLTKEAKYRDNPIELVASFSAMAEVSPAATTIKLVSILDPGYIYAQVDENNIIVVSGRSPGTAVSGLRWGMPVEQEAQFLVSEECWTGEIGGTRYFWWRLPGRVAIPVVQDCREWRKILDEILLDVTEAGPARQHAKQSINGVVGATNGRSSSQSTEELYAALLQRFEARRRDGSLYDSIARHPKFSDFLSQRVAALKR